jgi:small-conductance mechanosensitive channel
VEATPLVDRLLERLPPNAWLRALALVAAFLVLAKAVGWVGSRLAGRWARRTKSTVDDHLTAALHRPLFWSVLLFGLSLALPYLEVREAVATALQRLVKTTIILLWSIFVWKASRMLLTAFSRLEKKTPLLEPRTVPLLDNTLKVLIVSGVVYFLFITWGINVAAWMAGAGIVGIAVGFAAKDTLANLFAGVALIADAPYQNGDFIVLDSGERGMVTKIGLRSTRILTRDDIEITVPNSIIANQQIVNESGGPWTKQRIRMDIGVAYGSDLRRVREVLVEVANANDMVADDPEPRVRFRRFGDSALELQLLCWIAEPVLRGQVVDALGMAIYERFNAEGIVIPFPQRDVHVHRVPAE